MDLERNKLDNLQEVLFKYNQVISDPNRAGTIEYDVNKVFQGVKDKKEIEQGKIIFHFYGPESLCAMLTAQDSCPKHLKGRDIFIKKNMNFIKICLASDLVR